RFARQGTETEIYARLKSPEIVVTPGQEFSFSINARGTASNDGTDSSLPIHLYWCGERGAQLGSPILLKSIEKSTDWKTYSHSFIVPNGAHKGYILITLNQSNLPKGTFIEFSNPKIEGNGCKPQAFTPRNLHKFTVAAEDFLGHKAIKDFHILVAPEPRTKNVVTLRHDGAVLVDGKPFFPIGMYAVWKREHNDFDLDKAFKELHEAGFNLAHSYNATRDDEYKEFMDAALRHDVKLFIPGGKGVNSTDIDEIISDIANERNHPAVLAWYLSDDTAAYISPEKLSEINEAVHDIDPTRPTVQADPGGIKISRYRPYVNATDGFLPELYPVSTGTPPDMTVPKIITDMKMIQADLASKGSPAKTIWPIIQYFKGWGGWTRFPTFEELRAMSYESIIHGGNGITFYTYIRRRADNFGVLATPETWQNMKKVAGELNHLSPVFLAETPKQPQIVNILSGPQQDAQGHDSISTLYKVIDQKQYLICANSAFKDVTVNFVLPHAHRCDVLFEERTLNVSKNSFNDTFAPYAVHVYEIR
ncbi:MAG: hypothetical protein J6X55_05140, partial [Victivallales bacterium]|nr:hypothetical protein [Victivallales bacterium]